jgi:hypothetical protein
MKNRSMILGSLFLCVSPFVHAFEPPAAHKGVVTFAVVPDLPEPPAAPTEPGDDLLVPIPLEGLLSIRGAAADALFASMTEAKHRAASADLEAKIKAGGDTLAAVTLDDLEAKTGKSITCVRKPALKKDGKVRRNFFGKLVLETDCQISIRDVARGEI